MSPKPNMAVEDVVDALRSRIARHDLPPGSKLREIALAEEFDISRPRLREAFRVLEERGLIERIPNRGAVVARLSVEKVKALFDIREVLEALSVRLATDNAAPGKWEALLERFGEPTQTGLDRNDLDFYIDGISLFRQECIREARNEFLSQSLDRLYDRTYILFRRLVLMPGRAVEGMLEHREILKAMIAGDSAKAEALKRQNTRSAKQWFSSYHHLIL